jgi:AcrR family transcriptional regulator
LVTRIDREQRRVELAEAVWRVIVNRGIEYVSIRNVADESEWTRGVIQLYFRDKDDLLYAALDLVEERTAEIGNKTATSTPFGLDTVRALLMMYAQPGEEYRQTYIVLQALATRAVSHEEFGRRYRQMHRGWETATLGMFELLAESGAVRTDMPPVTLADDYYAFAMGLSFKYYVDPESLADGRAERVVDGFVRSIAPLPAG